MGKVIIMIMQIKNTNNENKKDTEQSLGSILRETF